MLAANEPTTKDLDDSWRPPSAEPKRRTVRRVTRVLTVELTEDDRAELLEAKVETERELREKARMLREKKRSLEKHIKALRMREYGSLEAEVSKLQAECQVHREELERGSRMLPVLVEERTEGGMLKCFRVDDGTWVRDVAVPVSRY